ncbi:LCP family protein [Microbispora sp. H10885]|uniref:LCP family protein n=1 Tax=Microbispora sp. H10885 TaxID=2729110 RepID=UPI0016028D19|nr:LCP family protein [Microbispora sp. H10885]
MVTPGLARRKGAAPATRRSGPARGAVALIAWVALSAVLPGAAHLRAGRRRTGLTLLGAYLTTVVCVAGVAAGADAGLAGRALGWLSQISLVFVACSVAWFWLVVRSYAVLRPAALPRSGQILTGLVAGVLAVAVAVPFAVAARYVSLSERTLDAIFTTPGGGGPAGAAGAGPEDPWAGRDRVNVLLLGGDWGADRIGMRTDSINVASVDVRTGRAVLLGLPRNLEHVRFPPGSPMAVRFPFGFRLPEYRPGWREDLLFSVWQYADDHPELFGGHRHMGAQVLKETVGYILGLRIDWYALVNIWGLAKMIDALGGIVLTVDRDIVYGRYDEGVVRAGTRRLDGTEALWYARSRTMSDDFDRMHRQRCLLGALLGQADPATVLTRFTQIAAATRRILSTDVPRPMLEHLVPLAWKVKHAGVTSLQFVPPLVNTAYPDWDRIRLLTARAIRDSLHAQTSPPAPPSNGFPAGPRRLRHRHSPSPAPVPPVPPSPGTPSPIGDGCGAPGTATAR